MAQTLAPQQSGFQFFFMDNNQGQQVYWIQLTHVLMSKGGGSSGGRVVPLGIEACKSCQVCMNLLSDAVVCHSFYNTTIHGKFV
jgi:hypothetical protein